MNLFKKKKTTFITIAIDGKAYDYPQDLPMPRIGEVVFMENSRGGRVTQVFYRMVDKTFRSISVYTELY